MDKLSTLIVDDELHARRGLRTLLARDAEIDIIGECANGQQALAELAAHQPDLVLLDIQMPDLNGFEVLAALDLAHVPALIFVTAYDQYALQAFEVSALDYLLKPFTDERFYQALARAKAQHRQRHAGDLREQLQRLLSNYQPAAPATTMPWLHRFPIKKQGEVHFVPAEEVDWLEADGYCTKLHCGRTTHLLRGHLGSFAAQLDPQRFLRASRSTLINLKRIECLKPWFHGKALVRLLDGTELPISRDVRRQVEEALARLA